MGDLNKEIKVDEEKQTEFAFADPSISDLITEYRDCITQNNYYFVEQWQNFNVRFSYWDGQTNDGRKHASRLGRQPFPWDGASDMRVHTVDNSVNTLKAMLLNAFMKAQLKAVPVNSQENSIAKATTVTEFMKWLVYSQMKELKREVELYADYMLDKGIAAMGIFWDRQIQKINVDLNLEDVLNIVEKQAQGLAVQHRVPPQAQQQYVQEQIKLFMLKLNDDKFTDELAEKLEKFYPDNSPKKLRRVIKDLRDKGQSKVTKLKKTIDRPCIQAFRLDYDLIVPVYTTDTENMPVIFRTEYMTPPELREKVLTAGWDAEWVEEVIEKTKGVPETDVYPYTLYANRPINNDIIAPKEYCKIVYAYRKLSDEDGCSDVYLTVFSANLKGSGDKLKESYGYHDSLGYNHGQYPFVFIKRENISRRLIETRGLSDVGRDTQNEVKVLTDARLDVSSMQVFPPMYYPVGQKPPVYRPGALIPTLPSGMGMITQNPIVTDTSTSVEIEGRLMERWDSITGLTKSAQTGQFSPDAQFKQQWTVNNFLEAMKQVMQQCFELQVQFGNKTTYFQVIGSNASQMQEFTISDDDEKYDFYLDYNVLNADADGMLNRIKMIAELAGMDKTGSINMAILLKLALESIDPIMAAQIVTPPAQNTQQQIQGEMDDISKMHAGFDVDAHPSDNQQLRLQVLQNYLKGTDAIPATDVQQKMKDDPAFKARIEKRIKQRQFFIQQQQNAQIGKTGTPPATYNGQLM